MSTDFGKESDFRAVAFRDDARPARRAAERLSDKNRRLWTGGMCDMRRLFEGKVAARKKNTRFFPDYDEIAFHPRPSHADYLQSISFRGAHSKMCGVAKQILDVAGARVADREGEGYTFSTHAREKGRIPVSDFPRSAVGHREERNATAWAASWNAPHVGPGVWASDVRRRGKRARRQFVRHSRWRSRQRIPARLGHVARRTSLYEPTTRSNGGISNGMPVIFPPWP